MNRIEFDSIWWKLTNLAPIGNHVLRIFNAFFYRNNTWICRDGDAATIDVLNYPIVFPVFSLLCCGTWLIGLMGKYGLATAIIYFEAPQPGYYIA